MTTSDNIAAIERLCSRLQERKKLKFMAPTANGPAQLVTIDDLFEAVEALSAYPALLAEARKAEAMKQEIAELREAAKFAIAALEAIQGYEADLGDELLDDYEIGRIEDSRHSPSFRIRVGHIRRLARTLLNGGSDVQG